LPCETIDAKAGGEARRLQPFSRRWLQAIEGRMPSLETSTMIDGKPSIS
jgi:hypothetical protein